MTQYISKTAVVAEIREILHNAEAYLKYHHNDNDRLIYSFKHQKLTMCELLTFLDTLEVKEVDLNKEISQFIDTNFEKATTGHKLSLRRIAKHFFELGLKLQKGE